jgi:CysZ protein
MGFFDGIIYNLRGLKWALKSPKLLALGMIRFFVVFLLFLICAGLLIAYHGEIMGLLWNRPESIWLSVVWHALSWVVSIFLLGISVILSYVVSQIIFSVIIMDIMSRLTEKLATGKVNYRNQAPLFKQFIYLVTQEIPRTLLPLFCIVVLTVLGWLTPLGPFLTVLSSLAAVIFLSWDNTDLIPARRLIPLNRRFRLLLKYLPFHLGFGVWFLIPLLNVLFLSFAPVGATLYAIDLQNKEKKGTSDPKKGRFGTDLGKENIEG